MAVGDFLEDGDEHVRLLARIPAVYQDGALLELPAVPFDHQRDHRVEQRVTGGEQVGARPARRAYELAFERGALVPAQHRDAGTDLPVVQEQVAGDVGDLVAAGLAFGDAPAEQPERGGDRGGAIAAI